MGWFGSLGLAYKYALVLGSLLLLTTLAGVAKIFYNRNRLKKFTKKAELEAAGAQEERVELNARELDEGDLFGIRAIQSGYYGGVAQSRPVSAAGSVSPDGSQSNTLLGSRSSPKLAATTRLSSVSALPLDSRQPSPLARNVVSTAEINHMQPPSNRNSPPRNSRLQPSEAELNGRINHDPTVNMSLDVPPSPISLSRPTNAYSINGNRSPSPSYPFPRANNSGNITPPALRPGTPREIQGSAQLFSSSEHPSHEIKSQSGSIVSRSTSANSNSDEKQALQQGQFRSPYQEYTELPTRPSRAVQIARPTSSGSYHPPRSSSVPQDAPGDLDRQRLDHEVPVIKPLQIEPAANNWGNALYTDVDPSFEAPKPTSIRGPSPNQGHPGPSRDTSIHHNYSNQAYGPPNQGLSNPSREPSPKQDYSDHPHDLSYASGYRQSAHDPSSIQNHPRSHSPSSSQNFTQHASKLSDSSSIYSLANQNQRMSRKMSLDSKTPSQTTSTLPSSAPSETDDHQHSPVLLNGTRRVSDASSHQPVSGSESNGGSSHRNTRELGDFYDSYWRQSTLGPGPMNGRGETGKQAPGSFSASRGAGEAGKDNRRPGQMDFKVATIAEVPTPLASPMPPGTAL